MGDSQRFKVFSKEINQKFPTTKYKTIADIAGGKGYLNKELTKKGYRVTTFDKRNNNTTGVTFKKQFFNEKSPGKYDLLVGMHPDQATDVIITEAAKRNVPFAIVPCCLMPCTTHYNGNNSYESWVHHLDMYARRLGFITFKKKIGIEGKNMMLYGIKKKNN